MHRLFIVVLILVTFLLADFKTTMAYEKEIKGISTAITENISATGKKTVAVVDFTDLQGNVTELGRFLAEELSVDLTIGARGFEVIDRTHLKSILSEHKLSISGLVDPSTVKKLGEIAGVDAIVTGSVTPFGDSIRVTCKVIATDTARVIGASKSDIAKTKAIEELLARGIETFIPGEPGTAPATSTPQTQQAKVAAKAEMPFFQNDSFKITAKSLKKTSNTIKLVLSYENITENNLEIGIYPWRNDSRVPYLTDENGERWNFKEVENIEPTGGMTDFPPKLPKMVKFTFSPTGDPNGTIFTSVINHPGYYTKEGRRWFEFQAVIRDIKTE